jgi:hypothetical protein
VVVLKERVVRAVHAVFAVLGVLLVVRVAIGGFVGELVVVAVSAPAYRRGELAGRPSPPRRQVENDHPTPRCWPVSETTPESIPVD